MGGYGCEYYGFGAFPTFVLSLTSRGSGNYSLTLASELSVPIVTRELFMCLCDIKLLLLLLLFAPPPLISGSPSLKVEF